MRGRRRRGPRGTSGGLGAGLTDSAEGVLEFQGEGGEGHVLRHWHDGHRGEVAGRVPRVPLAAHSMEPKLVTCRTQGCALA